jgi:hypothetical protein
MLPTFCRQDMQTHLEHVRQFHEEDLSRGRGRAPLPFALAAKYPRADREWGWQYLFPASSFYTDRHTGFPHRHHVHETVIQRAIVPARPRGTDLYKPNIMSHTDLFNCDRHGRPHRTSLISRDTLKS